MIEALGGLGLFLLGMGILTSALKTVADDQLRLWLAEAVDSPWKGVLTGAMTTALLQSSSATTVAAVGFVGAGMLTFPQAVGVILGANVGTTMTGWLVALVGFKLNLGQAMLPLILVGAVLRFSSRRGLQALGTAVAGFGLIFLGIESLQSGMEGLQGLVSADQFPRDTLVGRILLILLGIVITVITQSSSAGVAMALAAIHAGTISLNQGAAMVIGMNVGTTATALLATLGGNVHARRTGVAHVTYNVITAVFAFFFLDPYFSILDAWLPGLAQRDPEMVLVGFHTAFNVISVLAVLGFTPAFCRLIERLVPAGDSVLAQPLDRGLMRQPAVALDALEQRLNVVQDELLLRLERQLSTDRPARLPTGDVHEALRDCRDFVQNLAAALRRPLQLDRYFDGMHRLDHLHRIEMRMAEHQRLQRCRIDDSLSAMADRVIHGSRLLSGLDAPLDEAQVEVIHQANRDAKQAMRAYRQEMLRASAAGTLSPADGFQRMDTARSLRRFSYHLWRIAEHLRGPAVESDDPDASNSPQSPEEETREFAEKNRNDADATAASGSEGELL